MAFQCIYSEYISGSDYIGKYSYLHLQSYRILQYKQYFGLHLELLRLAFSVFSVTRFMLLSRGISEGISSTLSSKLNYDCLFMKIFLIFFRLLLSHTICHMTYVAYICVTSSICLPERDSDWVWDQE